MTYSCSYVPTVEGQYTVTVKFAGQLIPRSPFIVGVEGKAGDPSKVTASGPGLEQNGVVELKKTHFEVYTKGREHYDGIILYSHQSPCRLIKILPGFSGYVIIHCPSVCYHSHDNVEGSVMVGAYRVVQKKRYPNFIFAITSVNVHRF